MVITFESIDTKSLDEFGDTDLLSKVQSLRDAEVVIQEIVRVDQLTAMRLDLFCQAYYQSVVDLELFLLINGIVNPFDAPVGRILIMPEMSTLKKTLKTIDVGSVQKRNKEIASDNTKAVVSTSGVSRISNRKKANDKTRTIGFRKLDNGNLIF